MTAKTLFTIVLKVLGIFFVRDVLSLIPQLLVSLQMWMSGEYSGHAFPELGMYLLLFLVYLFVCYALIVKTDVLVEKMGLPESFSEEPIPLNIHRSTVLSISIIVLGGLVLVQQVPNFCKLIYVYFQERRQIPGETNPATQPMIVSGAQILIGLLLIGNQKDIVSFIDRKRRK